MVILPRKQKMKSMVSCLNIQVTVNRASVELNLMNQLQKLQTHTKLLPVTIAKKYRKL